MNDTKLRIFVVICVGVAVSGLIGWLLDKVFSQSRLRDALLTAACVYVALTLGFSLLKQAAAVGQGTLCETARMKGVIA